MIQILVIAILSLIAQLVLPWWSLAIVTFVVCFWRSSSALTAFVYSFLGIAIVWLGYSLWVYGQTDGVFIMRISQLVFKANNAVLPFVGTTILGGLVGGLAGLSGYFVRQVTGNQSMSHTA